MKAKVSFTANVTIEGDSVPRQSVVEAIELWIEDLTDAGDSVIEYISEEFDIDHLSIEIENPKVS